MQVETIFVSVLPGDLSVIVDGRPGSIVIWIQEGLSAEEVAHMIAQVWTASAQAGYSTRELVAA